MTERSTHPRSKSELLERMRAGREEWDARIAQIPETTLTTPVLGSGWSVKDLIAHVAEHSDYRQPAVAAGAAER